MASLALTVGGELPNEPLNLTTGVLVEVIAA